MDSIWRVVVLIGMTLAVFPWLIPNMSGLMWRAQEKESVRLYTRLIPTSAFSIYSALNQYGVPNSLVDNGSAIVVPKYMEDESRLKLALIGYPADDTAKAWDIYDQRMCHKGDVWKVAYLRNLALETSTRLINLLPGVSKSRIKLNEYPWQGINDSRQEPDAIVDVTLSQDSTLSRSTYITAVKILLSTHVERLDRSKVTVNLRG